MIKEEKPYCENCFKEDLNNYIIDSFGGVFCDDNCFSDSLEHRDLNQNQVLIEYGVEQ